MIEQILEDCVSRVFVELDIRRSRSIIMKMTFKDQAKNLNLKDFLESQTLMFVNKFEMYFPDKQYWFQYEFNNLTINIPPETTSNEKHKLLLVEWLFPYLDEDTNVCEIQLFAGFTI